jgi:hypothetical protein
MDDFYSDIIKFCVNKKFENDDKIYGNKRFDFFDRESKQLKKISHKPETQEENTEYTKIKRKIRKNK